MDCKKKPSYGGQAVIEGVMMAGPEGKAIAVRTEDGRIVIKQDQSIPWTKRHPFLGLPIIRGAVSFAYSLVNGVKDLTWAAAQAGETEDEKLTAKDMITAILGALIMVVIFFVALPVFAGTFVRPFVGDFGRSLVEGVLRLILFLGYVILIGRLPDIQRLFAYHGAEHKTINAFEAGEKLTPENVRRYSRIHKRCGTSFLMMTMIVMIVLFTFVGQTGAWLRIVIKLILLPLVAGLSYELFKLPVKYPNSLLVKILVAPGLATQRLTTREPSDDMLEVAITALANVPGFEGEMPAWTRPVSEEEDRTMVMQRPERKTAAAAAAAVAETPVQEPVAAAEPAAAETPPEPPVEEIPVEKPPVEESPVEEAPVEEVPVEEAPEPASEETEPAPEAEKPLPEPKAETPAKEAAKKTGKGWKAAAAAAAAVAAAATGTLKHDRKSAEAAPAEEIAFHEPGEDASAKETAEKGTKDRKKAKPEQKPAETARTKESTFHEPEETTPAKETTRTEKQPDRQGKEKEKKAAATPRKPSRPAPVRRKSGGQAAASLTTMGKKLGAGLSRAGKALAAGATVFGAKAALAAKKAGAGIYRGLRKANDVIDRALKDAGKALSKTAAKSETYLKEKKTEVQHRIQAEKEAAAKPGETNGHKGKAGGLAAAAAAGKAVQELLKPTEEKETAAQEPTKAEKPQPKETAEETEAPAAHHHFDDAELDAYIEQANAQLAAEQAREAETGFGMVEPGTTAAETETPAQPREKEEKADSPSQSKGQSGKSGGQGQSKGQGGKSGGQGQSKGQGGKSGSQGQSKGQGGKSGGQGQSRGQGGKSGGQGQNRGQGGKSGGQGQNRGQGGKSGSQNRNRSQGSKSGGQGQNKSRSSAQHHRPQQKGR